jgi:hypothetical protein
MKNTFKLFSIIAMLAVIAFSMTACEEADPGDDGVKKFMTINSIPGTITKDITVGICTQDKNKKLQMYAGGSATPANGSVTVPLISTTTGNQFTGTGDYYIAIYVNYKKNGETVTYDSWHYYTGTGNEILKYEIKKGSVTDTSVISWGQFKQGS